MCFYLKTEQKKGAFPKKTQEESLLLFAFLSTAKNRKTFEDAFTDHQSHVRVVVVVVLEYYLQTRFSTTTTTTTTNNNNNDE